MKKTETLKDVDIKECFSFFEQKQKQLEDDFSRLNPFEYKFLNSQGEERYNITKWFRNIAVMDNFQAVRARLSEFYVAVEFYQAKIKFDRVGIDFEKEYKQKFFLAVAADSLRSSLDILSKSIAWFFDLPNKDTIGFAFKSFIKPIKEISLPIFEFGNKIYKSEPFKVTKHFRDTQKHSGIEKNEFKLNNINANIKFSNPIDCLKIENALLKLFNMILNFSEICISEFLKVSKGYDSPRDQICKVNEKGNLAVETLLSKALTAGHPTT